MTELRLTGQHTPGIAEKTLAWRKSISWIARFNAYDIATVVLIAALVVIALCTFKDYAISNDEGVQHRYGELIIAYYTSGFSDLRRLQLPEPLSLWRPVRHRRRLPQPSGPDRSV